MGIVLLEKLNEAHKEQSMIRITFNEMLGDGSTHEVLVQPDGQTFVVDPSGFTYIYTGTATNKLLGAWKTEKIRSIEIIS